MLSSVRLDGHTECLVFDGAVDKFRTRNIEIKYLPAYSPEWKAQAENFYLDKLLQHSRGDMRKAAEVADISRGHMYDLLKKTRKKYLIARIPQQKPRDRVCPAYGNAVAHKHRIAFS